VPAGSLRKLVLSDFARDEAEILAAALLSPPAAGDVIKDESRTLIFRHRLPSGMDVVVKTYRRRSAYDFARESLSRFRAQREFDALVFLAGRQIPCSIPVAWACGGERRTGRFETLVTIEEPGMTGLKAHLRTGRADDGWIRPVARLVREGHEAGFYHGALAPRNVLLRLCNDRTPACLFIDTPKSIVFPKSVTGTRMARHDLLMLLCEVNNVAGETPLIPFLETYRLPGRQIPAMVAAIKSYRANRNTRNRMRAEFLARRMVS